MKKVILFYLAAAFVQCVSNQKKPAIRNSRLFLNAGETFKLITKELFVDSLVMNDSSSLILDRRFNSTTIRANYFFYGTYCSIDGSGLTGENGANLATENVIASSSDRN